MRFFFILSLLILLVSCKLISPNQSLPIDRTEMVINEGASKIDFASLKQQNIISFQERAAMAGNRGLLTSMTGGLISLATEAVKQIIKKDQSKYTAEYVSGLNNLVFYDQLSTESPFDPVGMKFNGFTMVRMVPGKQNKATEDTALVAEFELDNSNLYEIINNSTFRLRLADINVITPKAKIERKGPKKLNMDFEISFRTSYVNEHGVLFDDVVVGKFLFFLRDAPTDKNDPGYSAYYENLKGTVLEGRSFIVPRSFGYYMKPDGTLGKSFSQGVYSIDVKVKEASRNSFVTKLLINHSDNIVEGAGNQLKNILD